MTRAGYHRGARRDASDARARVALVIYALIIVSAVVIAVETLPGLTPETHRLLIVAEFTILTVFAIEYILRLACSPKPLSYAFSFWGIIDFIAIVPAVLFLFPDLTTVRAMRLLRLLRILKLLKANRALDRISQAIVQIRAEL
jgi:voltage-gated potassium channel